MKSFHKIDLQHIARYTHWPKDKIEAFLALKVYPKKEDWLQFSSLFSLILGVGLFCIGVVFFFAYNWNAIPGIIKLGLIFGLITLFTIASLYQKFSLLIKQLCLTAASLLVGVLFAVFGQIYQTGANAYDFFLAWVVFSILWVVVAKFIPLWILYFLLLNTALYFYFLQVKPNIPISGKTLCFLFLNAIPVLFDYFWLRYKNHRINTLFSFLFSTLVVSIASFYISYFIISWENTLLDLLTLFIGSLSLLFIAYLTQFFRQIYYLALLSLGVLVIGISIIVKIIPDIMAFFIIALFVISYVTAILYSISHLQKQWKDE